MVEEARAEAVRVGSSAREEAQQRIAAARTAADEALTDARAISEGLRKLGDMLGTHSERILRDVTAAHRNLAAELRVAASNANTDRVGTAGSASAPRERQANGGDEGPARTSRSGERGPLEGLELPSWVDE